MSFCCTYPKLILMLIWLPCCTNILCESLWPYLFADANATCFANPQLVPMLIWTACSAKPKLIQMLFGPFVLQVPSRSECHLGHLFNLNLISIPTWTTHWKEQDALCAHTAPFMCIEKCFWVWLAFQWVCFCPWRHASPAWT